MTAIVRTPEAVWAFEEHEHRDLTRGLNRIHEIACGINAWIQPELPTRVLGVLDWVRHELQPHMAWEEAVLYPELDDRTATPWATRSARFDHQQIRDVVARVERDHLRLHGDEAREVLPELRCHLFSLEALCRSHIEREERFLIPLLTEEIALRRDSFPDPATQY
jgi:iron-sulfur cluster repair protein YtfE (RIC family)